MKICMLISQLKGQHGDWVGVEDVQIVCCSNLSLSQKNVDLLRT